MKSIKPGRGPSAMGAMGSVFAAIFGVIWTVAAVGMGAPWFFCLFGIFFIGQAVVTGIYNYKNATGKNRYSEYDIVDEYEERDPFNDRFGREPVDDDRAFERYREERSGTGDYSGIDRESNFCPYCGAKADPDYEYCNKCGRKLP